MPCGDSVCLTVPDTIALSQWIEDVSEVQRALEGCPFIEVSN